MSGVFIGLSTLDLAQETLAWPDPNGKAQSLRARLHAGGPALNAAVTYAILGGEARLLSLLAADTATEVATREAEAFGVTVVGEQAGGAFSLPVSTVILNPQTGDRAILSSYRAHSETLTAETIRAAIATAKPVVVLVDGHWLPRGLTGLEDIPIVIDAGSWKPVFADLERFDPIFIAGERFVDPEGRDGLAYGQAKGLTRYAVTHGDGPIEAVDAGRSFTVSTPTVDAIDTLGAGDVFHGAVAWALAEAGQDFERALATAARVASEKCRYPGPRTGVLAVAAAMREEASAASG